MAQTEIVTKQALEERVRPVLFINKVDRLITELQLNEEQIQKKLDQIISRFNDLIELYAEPSFRDQWKIGGSLGNVAFGSALHGWGFTMNMAKRQSVKFSDITKAYANNQHMKLQKSLPVYEAIFEMAINVVPNPREAQGYRTETIWDGQTDSTIRKALVECSDDAPTVLFITNVHADSNGDTIATGRVFSGKVKKGDVLHLVDALSETEVKEVSIDMGALREEVSEVSAGCLASFTFTGRLKAGATLVDLAHKEGMVPFEGICYVSEPVVTLAVEPKNPQEIPLLLDALEKLAAEDPNLKVNADKLTGEYLLSGMGELHLEIAVHQLKSDGLNVTVSSPRVVYSETVQKKGVVALAKSPNKQNCFWVQVMPETEENEHHADDGFG